MGLRDPLRRVLRSKRRLPSGDNGDFPILGRSREELILGEDDRHLDFRASVLLRLSPDGESRDSMLPTG